MFAIEMLPADHGDCLVISYGDEKQPYRILIDAGTPSTFERLRQYIEEELPSPRRRHFELLIVTHIDSDHIGGVLPLLRAQLGITFGDIWFNAWHHLMPPVRRFLGPLQGDLLGNLLSQRPELPWNKAFGEDTVVIPDAGPLPAVKLRGGMTLTLLSPRWKELEALEKSWTDQAFRAGRIPGQLPTLAANAQGALELLGGDSRIDQLAAARFFPDSSAANGSSIAVLAEYGGKRALLTGDAFAPVLAESIQRIPGFGKRLEVDAVKLAHHGSEANLSRELLQLIKSNRYLVSTNGKIFNHPDDAAIARVLQDGGRSAKIIFNYKSPTTLSWKKKKLPPRAGGKSPFEYPKQDEGGILVRL